MADEILVYVDEQVEPVSLTVGASVEQVQIQVVENGVGPQGSPGGTGPQGMPGPPGPAGITVSTTAPTSPTVNQLWLQI
jgi:hypothetical protein